MRWVRRSVHITTVQRRPSKTYLKIPTLDFAVAWRMLERNYSDGVRVSRAGLELRGGMCCNTSPPSGKPVKQTLGEATDRWHVIE